MTQRLIETWLPIAAIGEESVRERRSMTALPPVYYLHVWWARRPLVASRAAILASLLPADADREKFMYMLGIHGDPVAARKAIDQALRTGERIDNPYGYSRAFSYTPSQSEKEWLQQESERAGVESTTVLDPTAGGGSVPFESVRLGLTTTANDLNPVAALILRATVEWPATLGYPLLDEFNELAKVWRAAMDERLAPLFPPSPIEDAVDITYLWARTITCPYCDGLIPLSPNWRLAPNGTGLRLLPDAATKRCAFQIVTSAVEHSEGTVARGDAKCPYPACGRIVHGDEIKRQAQAGGMGEQLYAVVFKRKVVTKTKSGKEKVKWVRGYRAPRLEDDNSSFIREQLDRKLPEWEAAGVVPTERFPESGNDLRPITYGMPLWRDLFGNRQLLTHGTGSEVFAQVVATSATDLERAAAVYLAFCLDKMLNYNSRMSVWMPTREVVANTFNRHDFAFCASHAEMAPLVVGLGYDWTVEQTAKCIEELITLARPDLQGTQISGSREFQFEDVVPLPPPNVTVTCQSGDSLTHVDDRSVDCVVMDPPYYDNVMYAELSDFFYVWLKRTAGRVYPELFRRQLTDKDSEAVANTAKFDGQKGAKALAARDYQQRMAGIFAECRRVLKADGIMTLMFTHKATGAWDALASGLMEAGFTITASWPINTEAEGSLHIKDKSAANSTIFLVCRPREQRSTDDEPVYWEDVEPRVAKAVRARVEAHQAAGIGGVDLYLSCFGPALEEFAKHWPLKRGTPRVIPARKRKSQESLFGEAADPYAVTPEDALDAARREVKQWRLEKLLRAKRQDDLDPLTEWFVLAWDAFKAPEFPYDEGLRLARVVGVDLDAQVVGKLTEKKASHLVLWDSAKRAAKGAIGAADGSGTAIDAVHNVAWRVRQQNLQAGRDLVERVPEPEQLRIWAE